MGQYAIAITGAGGALGRAVVEAATARGARVAAIDRVDFAGASAKVLWLGGVDLADPVAANLAMSQAAGRLGGLDALINLVGGFRWQTLADGDLAAWDDLYRLNVLTVASACKAALPMLAASLCLTLPSSTLSARTPRPAMPLPIQYDTGRISLEGWHALTLLRHLQTCSQKFHSFRVAPSVPPSVPPSLAPFGALRGRP